MLQLTTRFNKEHQTNQPEQQTDNSQTAKKTKILISNQSNKSRTKSRPKSIQYFKTPEGTSKEYWIILL